jgi:hypothetical protein
MLTVSRVQVPVLPEERKKERKKDVGWEVVGYITCIANKEKI